MEQTEREMYVDLFRSAQMKIRVAESLISETNDWNILDKAAYDILGAKREMVHVREKMKLIGDKNENTEFCTRSKSAHRASEQLDRIEKRSSEIATGWRKVFLRPN